MGVIAFDLIASAAQVDAALSARIATSGQQWQNLAAGFAASHLVRYSDNAANGAPKRINPNGNQRLNYLPVAFTGRLLRAQARRAVLSIAATARGFLGVGFIDSANGNGYFGGWLNDATPKATGAIVKSNGAAGTLDVLASWNSAAPFSAPFARLMAFSYDRETGGLSFSWDGLEVVSIDDFSYLPLYPAVISHDMAVATPIDALLEAVYDESGVFTPSSPFLAWVPIGVNEWRGEATVNFADTPAYSFVTEAQLLVGYVRAVTMVFSTFGADSDITASIDGTPVTLRPGTELVLAAPLSERVSLAGTVGVLRVRLYTMPYNLYQRG